MRWNVIAGGQIVSKSMRGYTYFHYEWFGREGLIVGFLIVISPLVLLYIITRLLPVLEDLRGPAPNED